VAFNSLEDGNRIVAYFYFNGIVGRHAIVSFHLAIHTPIQGNRFRENADRHALIPAPNFALFSIRYRDSDVVLQPFFNLYWLAWGTDYDIVVGGEVWETFIYQEQLSRCTVIHPSQQHNLLNDGLEDIEDDEEDEEDGEDDEEGQEGDEDEDEDDMDEGEDF
jgi:hypothetical protein